MVLFYKNGEAIGEKDTRSRLARKQRTRKQATSNNDDTTGDS